MNVESSPQSTEPIVEQITPYLRREWFDNRQIVVFDIDNVIRETVDKTYALMQQTMIEWDLNRPYLAINDFATSHAALSPYAQKQLRQIRMFRPELKGYVAIVMPSGIVTSVIRIFVRTSPGIRENEMFPNREAAFQWLRSKRPVK
ncbi:MAG: hypothetical protein IAE83_10200 [Anaerolinea sp.]|nr:hypothetical protein [Anaerolinea sp.]CAG1011325.1 hypothetical protein ANRL4_04378 [Anaerolineae bacterium]